jgi:Protein of unknown function (DUF2934)
MRKILATKAASMDNEPPAMDKEAPAANEPLPERPVLPSAAELYELIAEAAYYRAQKRGFTPGLEAQDWVDAEAEVMERVRKAYTDKERS